MTEHTLTEAEAAAHIVARSWISAEIQSWSERVGEEAKVENLRGPDTNLVVTLKPPKSPLEK